jgi:hypothetical protein
MRWLLQMLANGIYVASGGFALVCLLHEPCFGASSSDGVPPYLSYSNIIAEGSVLSSEIITRSPSTSCGGGYWETPPLYRYEMLRLHVDRVYVGVVPADTVTLVRWLVGDRQPKNPKLGSDVLIYGSFTCLQYGNIAGHYAVLDHNLQSYVFDETGAGQPRLANISRAESDLASIAARRNQATVESPDALVEVRVVSDTVYADGNTIMTALPTRVVAGAYVAGTPLRLHFRGSPGCGTGVAIGEMLLCPLNAGTTDLGFCPETFATRSGLVSFFGATPAAAAELYRAQDGKLVARQGKDLK